VPRNQFKTSGLRRLVKAMSSNYSGIAHALEHDPAIRQVSFAVFVVAAASVFVPVSRVEHLLYFGYCRAWR